MKRALRAAIAAGVLATSVAACSLALDFQALECPEGSKGCDGGCVAITPDVGCGAPSCEPCFAGDHFKAECTADGTCKSLGCAGAFLNCSGGISCETDSDSDEHHCGNCEEDCTAKPNATAASRCVKGLCVVACQPPFGDCDRSPHNGCEADLRPLGGACGPHVERLGADTPHGIAVLDGTILWSEDLDGGAGGIRSNESGAVVCGNVSSPQSLSYAPGDNQLFFSTHDPTNGDILRYTLDSGCHRIWKNQSTRYGKMSVSGGKLYYGLWYSVDGGPPPSGSVLVGDLDAGAAMPPDVLVSKGTCTDTTCSVHSVLVDESGMWWTDSYQGRLFHATTEGKDVTWSKPVPGASFITADDDSIYFTGYKVAGAVYAVDKKSREVRTLVTGQRWPDAIAVDADRVYWTSDREHPTDCDASVTGVPGGIWSIKKDGSEKEPRVVAYPSSPWGLVIENGTLYYTDVGCVGGQGHVIAAPIGDTGVGP